MSSNANGNCRLVELAAPEPGWAALDIASRGGRIAVTLAPAVAHMVALGFTCEELDGAMATARACGVTGMVFALGESDALPFDAASFDLVTCQNVAHEIPDVPRLLAEVARVLRPGGRFVLEDRCVPAQAASGAFINVFERLHDPNHACAYSAEGWVTLVERAGLAVEASETHEERLNLGEWVSLCSGPPDLVDRLDAFLADAPEAAKVWADPAGQGAARTFITRNVVIAARLAG